MPEIEDGDGGVVAMTDEIEGAPNSDVIGDVAATGEAAQNVLRLAVYDGDGIVAIESGQHATTGGGQTLGRPGQRQGGLEDWADRRRQ